jgi:hypothetical protein
LKGISALLGIARCLRIPTLLRASIGRPLAADWMEVKEKGSGSNAPDIRGHVACTVPTKRMGLPGVAGTSEESYVREAQRAHHPA